MTRVPFPAPETLPAQVTALLEALPVHLNVTRALTLAPTALVPCTELSRALLVESELSPRHRELLIMLVAHHTHSAYVQTQHIPIARMTGVTDEELNTLASDPAWCPPDPADAALVDAGRQLLETCSLITPSVKALRQHFSDRQLAEAILLVGYYRMMAGLLNALDVDIDPQGDLLAALARSQAPK